MFRIVDIEGKARLVSQQPLGSGEFDAIELALGTRRFRARKIGFIAARKAEAAERIVTHWNGRESANEARLGDYVVTNLGTDRRVLRDRDGNANIYVIRGETFASLYLPTGETSDHGTIHRAIGEVEALPLPGGFEIVAPWGEVQRGAAGYLIRNGNDIYGNHQETFDATYERLS